MVVFGGTSGSQPVSDETWTYALRGTPVWRRLEPAGPRPQGQGHTAILDTKRDRMIVFGLCPPFRAFSPPPCSNEVWSLSFSGEPAWSQLAPSGEPPEPSPFSSKAAILDPIRDRMIVVNGGGSPAVHALALAGAAAWSRIGLPGEAPGTVRGGRGACCDRAA